MEISTADLRQVGGGMSWWEAVPLVIDAIEVLKGMYKGARDAFDELDD
jgi:hypothetical protein